jgi:hypothetical protein
MNPHPHQSAKAAVAKMAVMAIEINNESAANLIQAITVHNFPVGSIAECPSCVVIFFMKLWPFRAARCRNFS